MKKMQMAVVGLVCAGIVCSVSAFGGEGRGPGNGPGHGQGRAGQFKAADTDGDGAISLAEFEAMHSKRQEKAKERLGDRYDPERAARRPAAEDIFKRIDADGNGSITPAEMAAANARRQARMGEGKPRRHRRGDDAGEEAGEEAEPAAE